MFKHLRRGGEELTRVLIAEDREVCGECILVRLSFRGSEYGFESCARFLHKHAKKRLSVIIPSETAGVADEEANCFPKACEAGLCFLEERRALGECIRTLKDPKGVQVSGWGAEGRAECGRGADFCPKVISLVKLRRFIRATMLVS